MSKETKPKTITWDTRDATFGTGRPAYWRSLYELADRADFQAALSKAFPAHVAALSDPVSRREFLRLMGGSLGLAGLTACTRPPREKIVPYVRQPEEIVPGKPLFFATAMPINGLA